MQIPKSAEIPANDWGSKGEEIDVENVSRNQIGPKELNGKFPLKVFDK